MDRCPVCGCDLSLAQAAAEAARARRLDGSVLCRTIGAFVQLCAEPQNSELATRGEDARRRTG